MSKLMIIRTIISRMDVGENIHYFKIILKSDIHDKPKFNILSKRSRI